MIGNQNYQGSETETPHRKRRVRHWPEESNLLDCVIYTGLSSKGVQVEIGCFWTQPEPINY